MTRSQWITSLAAIGAIALTSAAPPHQLPRCVNSPFEGITQTDPNGTIVGDPDAGDWGCVGRGNSQSGAGGLSRTSIATPADVPVPPPTAVCMDPAAPNPAEFSTRLQYALPAAAHATLSIYGRSQGHGPRETAVVRALLEGDFQPGFYTVVWDLKDDDGARVPAGIYRAVLVVGDEALCGDIEVR